MNTHRAKSAPRENSIQDFWQENPCGENLTGKLDDWAAHFDNYDEFRYRTEGHILGELDQIDFAGKKVLEIGIGQAADSLQIAKRGGIWHGLDLTDAAITRARVRFELNQQSYGDVKQGSATQIPWPDDYFDIVYSHGVLHHIPDIHAVQQEISRVLKPDGRLVIMMYHKNSLNYWLSIAIIRRIGLLLLFLLDTTGIYRSKPASVFGQHIANAKREGLLSYLRMKSFIHRNTDGPLNPYAKAYTVQSIAADFPCFAVENSRIHFLNARHFPGIRLLPKHWYDLLDSRLGWHLWAFMSNRKT
jgi:ubiquinone/menaquinone biosynthesis C-methylase UbiE